jgi:hypothetical protein
MSDGQNEISKTRVELAKFQTLWNQRVQPQIERTGAVPAQFIRDVFQILADQLAPPFIDLKKTEATARFTSFFAEIFGGPGGKVSTQAMEVAAAASAEAADTLMFTLTRIIGPLGQEAKQAQEAHGKNAMIQIVTSGPDRLDRVIVGAFTSTINAWQRMAQIQELANSSLLFRLAKFQLESSEALARAIVELVRVIVAAGKAVYETVVGVGRFVGLAIKVALVGGAAYVGYRVYQGTRKPPPSAAPTQNPYRRRRRRRRASARGGALAQIPWGGIADIF